jgi:hypothetical protein
MWPPSATGGCTGAMPATPADARARNNSHVAEIYTDTSQQSEEGGDADPAARSAFVPIRPIRPHMHKVNRSPQPPFFRTAC